MRAQLFFRRMVGHSGSLKFRVFRAGSWSLFGYGIALVLRLFGNLVTTRLLAPEVFGIMAIATTVHVVIGLIGDIGLRQAVIQSRNGDDQRFLDTAWTVQALRGGLIWLVCVCFAVALSTANSAGWLPTNSVYGDPSLPSILAATTFSSVILGLQSMKVVSRSRGLDLQRITLIELIQMVVGLTVAIVLGWLTHSIWSFVASGLAGSAVTTILSRVWLPGTNDRFAWDRAALNEIVRFGRWVLVSSIIGVLAMNGDRLLLGGWVTATVLGYYTIASNLSSFADGIGGRIFGSVSLPALSEVAREQPGRFAEVFWRMRWGADCSYVVLAGFLFVTGESIIEHLYDARYLPSGAILQWLSFGLLFSRYGLAQSAYVARGRQDYLAAINLVKLVSLFVLVPAAFHFFGTQGAIIGIAFYLLPTVPLIWWFNSRLKLNNALLELTTIAMWPAGWLLGYSVLAAVRYLTVH